jgi:hypothetical protein
MLSVTGLIVMGSREARAHTGVSGNADSDAAVALPRASFRNVLRGVIDCMVGFLLARSMLGYAAVHSEKPEDSR